MDQVHELEARRKQVLQELGRMGSLRKGSLNEQWFPVVRDGKRTEELRGPYFVWSCKAGKKTISERVTGEQALASARQDAANYRRFRELCGELEQIIGRLGEAQRQLGSASQEALKKGLKPRSNKAGKSGG